MENTLVFLLAALPFVGIGFIAQMIDGALGMAYGVSSTSLLLSLGVAPAIASASVHTAEIFTTGVSGLSHFRFGNVDKALFIRLILPGVIGGVLGAYVLINIPVEIIKPLVSSYLLIMGVIILRKFIRNDNRSAGRTPLIPLCFAGGFLDAIGGGGWGPIVTSTLVARGTHPRSTIGSVNSAEFFVTLAESVTFFLTLGLANTEVIVGLLVGGVIAAPFGAYLTKRLPLRIMLLLVGVLIILLSARTLYLEILG